MHRYEEKTPVPPKKQITSSRGSKQESCNRIEGRRETLRLSHIFR